MPALDADTLHPRLRAAMQRDGIQLYYLAALVGLDARTVRRWGVADSDSRAPAFRRLEDWIAGRARAVELEREDGERAWALEHLGERGIPPAEVARMLDEVDARWREWSGRVDAAVAVLRGDLNEKPSPPRMDKDFTPLGMTEPLRRVDAGSTTIGMLNNAILTEAARTSKVRRGASIEHEMLSVRVPVDLRDRVDATAKRYGMTRTDFVRALFVLFSEAQETGV